MRRGGREKRVGEEGGDSKDGKEKQEINKKIRKILTESKCHTGTNECYLPGEELAEMVVEPDDAFPFPLESGRLGEGGEGMGRHRAAVRFLAALRGVLWFEERRAKI